MNTTAPMQAYIAVPERKKMMSRQVKPPSTSSVFTTAIAPLLDRNFDLRCEVCSGSVSAKNRRMVELARSVGASAKFTGSGGAIIGTYRDNMMFKKLTQLLRENDIEVIKPHIVRTGKQA